MHIKLPYKVKHSQASERDGCRAFNGIKFIEYNNGKVHLHVELVKDTGDDYKFWKELKSVTPVKCAVCPLLNKSSPTQEQQEVPGEMNALVNEISNKDSLLSQMNIDEEVSKTEEYATTPQKE